jgi:uncharacterized protein (DUF2267 family)
MTIPMELQQASADFESFLADARDIAGLSTRNQTYTMVEGVFRTFRRRLVLGDAIRFANILPPLLRAIFVANWEPSEPPVPFDSRNAMTREAQALRSDHNVAPDTCLHDVAAALRRHVDENVLERLLSTLPGGASDFWRVEGQS